MKAWLCIHRQGLCFPTKNIIKLLCNHQLNTRPTGPKWCLGPASNRWSRSMKGVENAVGSRIVIRQTNSLIIIITNNRFIVPMRQPALVHIKSSTTHVPDAPVTHDPIDLENAPTSFHVVEKSDRCLMCLHQASQQHIKWGCGEHMERPVVNSSLKYLPFDTLWANYGKIHPLGTLWPCHLLSLLRFWCFMAWVFSGLQLEQITKLPSNQFSI